MRLLVASSSSSDDTEPVDLSDIPKCKLLGSGSFGTVWRVNWQGVLCALKTIVHQEPSMEGPIAFGLTHPNIITTLAHQTRSTQENMNITFILMEECLKTLEHAIQEKMLTFQETGELNWKRIRIILLDVAKGLAYVHSRGYVHLDLKPANIFLCPDADKDDIAKVSQNLCSQIRLYLYCLLMHRR